MEDFWINWLLLFVVFGLPLISPGPDFVVSVRNSIVYSRKAGLFTVIGFMGGVIVHVTYTLLGIATIIAQSVVLFNILKYAGAAYLFYIGLQALRSQGFKDQGSAKDKKTKKDMSAVKAIWIGFLTNVLNPKATLFFLAVFSQFIGPETTIQTQLIYGATCVVMTGIWFSLVAVILTNPIIKEKFLQFTKWIDKVCGMLLIGLGIKLALTKAI